MSKSFHLFDYHHRARLGRLSKPGLALGVPCMLIGVGLFVSVSFTSNNSAAGLEFSPAQLVIGVVTIAVGGFCAMGGLPTQFAAHSEKVLGRPSTQSIPSTYEPNKLDVQACKTCDRPRA